MDVCGVNSRPRPFYPPGKNAGTERIWGWVGTRVGLEMLKKGKIH